jgi:hypothetical protein
LAGTVIYYTAVLIVGVHTPSRALGWAEARCSAARAEGRIMVTEERLDDLVDDTVVETRGCCN